MFPRLEIGAFSIYFFSIFAALGFASFVLLFVLTLDKKYKVTIDELWKSLVLAFIAIGVGVGGAMLLDATVHSIQNGYFAMAGISWYGMLIAGLLAFSLLHRLFAKKMKFQLSAMQYLNLIAVGMSLGHAFGRIGCFMAGCCFGGPTDSAFGVNFPEGSMADIVHGGQALWPVQLFEAVGLFSMFAFMFVIPFIKIPNKFFEKYCKGVENNSFYIYLIGYSVLRFLLEFMRGDNRGGVLDLSPGQIISLIVIAVIVVPILVYYLVLRLMLRKTGFTEKHNITKNTCVAFSVKIATVVGIIGWLIWNFFIKEKWEARVIKKEILPVQEESMAVEEVVQEGQIESFDNVNKED
ncbi:MAG: prolipoprotein diacylglyceryl transferase [Firmicutes bacterium]|nr:prolipoprotein diacylglyceryl transferase [Bacillota bacterium]